MSKKLTRVLMGVFGVAVILACLSTCAPPPAPKIPTGSLYAAPHQRELSPGESLEITAIVKRNGKRLPWHNVMFDASAGTFSPGKKAPTDTNGVAKVTWTAPANKGDRNLEVLITVTCHIPGTRNNPHNEELKAYVRPPAATADFSTGGTTPVSGAPEVTASPSIKGAENGWRYEYHIKVDSTVTSIDIGQVIIAFDRTIERNHFTVEGEKPVAQEKIQPDSGAAPLFVVKNPDENWTQLTAVVQGKYEPGGKTEILLVDTANPPSQYRARLNLLVGPKP